MACTDPDMYYDDILRALTEQAVALWGKERAQEVSSSLQQTAQQLVEVNRALPDREGDRENDNFLDYATQLAELSTAGLVDNVLGTGTKSGYAFALSGSTFDWQASATPESTSTGTRNFIVCTDGVVRFSALSAATCSSAAIQ